MTERIKSSRRRFLQSSLGAAATLGFAAQTPFSASSYSRIIGANDRIRVGVIGCGGMGSHHVNRYKQMADDPDANVDVVAVCDAYTPRLERAAQRSGAKPFRDYRKLLEHGGVDAVLIATPDHWHAKMSIDAMEAGKDVHVEKPMTLYWEEAREVYRTAKRTGAVVQVGAEGCSDDLLWRAREIVGEGALGKILWSTGGVYRNVKGGDWNYKIDPDCSPDNLDWEAFLGPAPKRPFDPERFFRYRKYWDYSGGLAHDLLSHILSGLMIPLGPSFPKRVMAAGGIYVHHDRDVPDTFHMMVDYPGDHTVTLFTTQATERGIELAIRGQEATLVFEATGGNDEERKLVLKPEKPFAEGREEKVFTRRPRPSHDENWLQCIRTRGTPNCDVRMGYMVMVALDLANRSWREGRMMRFDPDKEELIG